MSDSDNLRKKLKEALKKEPKSKWITKKEPKPESKSKWVTKKPESKSKWITKKSESKWITKKEPEKAPIKKPNIDLKYINTILKEPTEKVKEIFKKNYKPREYKGGGLAQRGLGRAFKKGGRV